MRTAYVLCDLGTNLLRNQFNMGPHRSHSKSYRDDIVIKRTEQDPGMVFENVMREA